MNGNIEQNLQALGAAMKSAQCEKCYYYPGMKGDILAESIAEGIKPSLNERNAVEFGWGASLAGARTAVILKTVGLASCVDSVQHAVIQGVHGGMVIVILEDTVAASSPEIVDSRLLLDYVATITIEPSSMASALEHVQRVFTLSEELDVPVILRLTHNLLASEPAAAAPADKPAARKPRTLPAYREKMLGSWADRSKEYEAKLDRIAAYIDALYPPDTLEDCQSLSFGYAKPAEDEHQSLSVEHYPVAGSLMRFYAERAVTVHELGSNYAEQKLRSGAQVRVDNSPAVAFDIVPLTDWEDALKTIDKRAYSCVIGDEGRFTLDSTGLIDVCLCMGSSIAICAGISEVTGSKNLAVIGDFSYQFNGYPSILEAYHRGVSMDIVLLDDGRASSTGGQASIAAIRPEDVAHYLHTYKELQYQELPDGGFVAHDAPGISMYRVIKG
jgi:indolepyruvate ferredoxin oxidoreductase alpha subunit